MSNANVCYRKLVRYKYQLMEQYTIQVEIHPAEDIVMDFLGLTTGGQLTIKKRYAWDGPSGPTIDTKTFMRGSLVHDALYQLMREKRLGQEHRKYADELLWKVCRKDGMCRLRAWWVYQGVRIFAARYARPSSKPPDELIWAPEPPPGGTAGLSSSG